MYEQNDSVWLKDLEDVYYWSVLMELRIKDCDSLVDSNIECET